VKEGIDNCVLLVHVCFLLCFVPPLGHTLMLIFIHISLSCFTFSNFVSVKLIISELVLIEQSRTNYFALSHDDYIDSFIYV
jgi:hypothetical protein